MSQIKSRKIDSALVGKGFRKENSGRDHHFYFYFYNGKKTTVYTKLSHSGADIGDPLLGMMSRQVKLAKPEFVELISCTLSSEEYLEHLVASGHVKD